MTATMASWTHNHSLFPVCILLIIFLVVLSGFCSLYFIHYLILVISLFLFSFSYYLFSFLLFFISLNCFCFLSVSLYFLFTELSLSAHFQIKLELIMLLFLSVFSLSLLAAFELMELFPSSHFVTFIYKAACLHQLHSATFFSSIYMQINRQSPIFFIFY